MQTLVVVVAVFGIAATLFACARMLLALRRNAPREVVSGWIALMIASALVVFAVNRLL